MGIVSRALSVFLLLMAVVVVFLWISSPTLLIDNSDGTYPMWERANWFMGLAAIPIMLVVSIYRKVTLWRQERAEGGGGITREYLEVNLGLGAAIVVTMWYYWNWLHSLLPTDESALLLVGIHLQYWGLIHPVFVFLSLAVASYLWRCGGKK